MQQPTSAKHNQMQSRLKNTYPISASNGVCVNETCESADVQSAFFMAFVVTLTPMPTNVM